MRRARKKTVVIRAYRLGERSSGLDKLVAAGLVVLRNDGSYEVHTEETKDGKGEMAHAGDYVKLDASGRPYPNEAGFFEENHRHIDGDQYEQISKDREVWMMGDAMCPEIELLIKQGRLELHKEDPEHYFQGTGWGTKLIASSDAALVFYEIKKNSDGKITDAEFNFVDRETFEETYELIRDKEPVRYDAFISYSHSEPDAFVAGKLHTMLEHYKVPKKIREISGKKKIERVFRDREELPLSANLAMGICEALENSEYLIVICSPRSVKSEWVQREIETFLLTHTKDKVLTLLAEGEPEEAFPDILCYEERMLHRPDGKAETVRERIEPMAADVRGTDHREIEKKLKEEFLRILAPMLGCTYDELKQRHRDYMLRRVIAGVSAAAVLAIGVTAFTLYQAAKTEAQYQEARRNQARYLAGISGDLLDSGDRMGALKTVMAITPDDSDADEPVVPEQMYALNQALYSYQHTDTIVDYKTDRSYELDAQVQAQDGNQEDYLSPDGTTYFCLDQQGTAYVLDVESGTCAWKINPGKLKGYDGGAFQYVAPVSDSRAVAVSQEEILILDWKKKRVVSQIERQEEEIQAANPYYAISGMELAVTNGQILWIYDLEQEACIHQIEYESDSWFVASSMVFNEAGNEIVMSTGSPAEENVERGVVCISLEDEGVTRLSDTDSDVVTYAGEHRVAVVQCELAGEVEAYDDKPPLRYYVTMYDTESGERVWTSEDYDIQAISRPCTIQMAAMTVGGNEQSLIAVSLKDKFLQLDSETGSTVCAQVYSSNIAGVRHEWNEWYIVGLEDGRMYPAFAGRVIENTGDLVIGEIHTDIGNMVYSDAMGSVIRTEESGRKVIFSNRMQDTQMKKLTFDSSYNDIEYISVPDSNDTVTYRVVKGKDGTIGDVKTLSIFECGDEKAIYEYQCGDDSRLDDVTICKLGDRTCLMFYDKERGETMVDLDTGKVLCRQLLREGDYQNYAVQCFHQTERCVVYGHSSFFVADMTEDGIDIPDKDGNVDNEKAVDAGNLITDIAVTADDKYVVVEVTADMSENYFLKIWDVEAGKWKKIDGREEYQVGCRNGIANRKGFEVGKASPVLAVYTTDGMIDILDLETGSRKQSLASGYFETMQCTFMDGDQYLLSYGDEQYLTMWDMESGKVRMQDDSGDASGNLVTDGSDGYFGIMYRGYRWSDGDYKDSSLRVYSVDDDGQFYAYADVPSGYASFDGNEIFVVWLVGENGYYAPLYDYQKLKKRAEDVLDGATLTDAEKKQYFVSE